jgi:hypothetical protein
MSDEINVLSRTQLIYVEPSSGSVSIINAGPAGAGGGATGPQGVSIILKGTVGSFTALPTGAHSGDAYVTIDDGHIWVWNVVAIPGSPPTLARDSSSWSRHMPYIAANTDLVWGAIGPWPTLGPNRAISVTSPADIHKNWAEQVASNDFNVSAFTIGAWIWIPSGLGSGRTIFCNGGNISSVFNGYALAYNLNLDRLILAYGNSYIQSSGYVNRPGWHHVAVSHDGTTARFYIDGVLDSAVSWARTPSTIPVGQSIGNLYPGEPLDQEWIGRLAGIFVSPSELSLATLAEIKNATSSAAYVDAVNATSPLGLWMLDEAIEATGWVDVGQLRGQQGPAGIPGEVGSAEFPITEDDGFNTYTIDVTSGILKIASSRDTSGGDDVASVTAATTSYSDDSAAGLHASTPSLNAEFQVMVSESLPNEPTFRFIGPYGIAQLVIGSGNPNTSGLNNAYKGSLYIDTGNAKLYQNTDGAAAWALVGGSAGDAIFNAITQTAHGFVIGNAVRLGSPAALLSTDSFNRADNPFDLGSTNGAGTLDPMTWINAGSQVGINGNRAYPNSNSFSTTFLNLGTADVDISVVTADSSGGAFGTNGVLILFRNIDSGNRFYAQMNSAGVSLFKRQAGGFVQIGTTVPGATVGDTLRVVTSGSNITVYRNSTLVITATDTFNQTVTNHGIGFTGAGASGNPAIDSFSASSSAGPAGTYVKAQADLASHAEALGLVSKVVDADHFELTQVGKISGLSGLVSGTTYWLSPSSSGVFTQTEPITSGQVSKPLLIADGTTGGYILNHRGRVIP